MDTWVLAPVLLAAALHAGWNLMVKMGGDKLCTAGLLAGTGGLICLCLVAFFPLPLAEAWPYIVASAVIHTFYRLFLVKAYHHGDMGVVYPIARGVSPVLVALGALAFAGERLDTAQVCGVAAIVVAICGLTFTNGRRNIPLLAVGFALGTAVTIACYTVVDGLGGRLAGSPHAYFLWMKIIDGVIFPSLVIARRGRAFFATARANWRPGVAGAAMAATAYWIVIWAMSITPMAPVSALRETSVLFGALLSGLVLKEGKMALRLVAAIIIACGVVSLQF